MQDYPDHRWSKFWLYWNSQSIITTLEEMSTKGKDKKGGSGSTAPPAPTESDFHELEKQIAIHAPELSTENQSNTVYMLLPPRADFGYRAFGNKIEDVQRAAKQFFDQSKKLIDSCQAKPASAAFSHQKPAGERVVERLKQNERVFPFPDEDCFSQKRAEGFLREIAATLCFLGCFATSAGEEALTTAPGGYDMKTHARMIGANGVGFSEYMSQVLCLYQNRCHKGQDPKYWPMLYQLIFVAHGVLIDLETLRLAVSLIRAEVKAALFIAAIDPFQVLLSNEAAAQYKTIPVKDSLTREYATSAEATYPFLNMSPSAKEAMGLCQKFSANIPALPAETPAPVRPKEAEPAKEERGGLGLDSPKGEDGKPRSPPRASVREIEAKQDIRYRLNEIGATESKGKGNFVTIPMSGKGDAPPPHFCPAMAGAPLGCLEPTNFSEMGMGGGLNLNAPPPPPRAAARHDINAPPRFNPPFRGFNPPPPPVRPRDEYPSYDPAFAGASANAAGAGASSSSGLGGGFAGAGHWSTNPDAGWGEGANWNQPHMPGQGRPQGHGGQGGAGHRRGPNRAFEDPLADYYQEENRHTTTQQGRHVDENELYWYRSESGNEDEYYMGLTEDHVIPMDIWDLVKGTRWDQLSPRLFRNLRHYISLIQRQKSAEIRSHVFVQEAPPHSLLYANMLRSTIATVDALAMDGKKEDALIDLTTLAQNGFLAYNSFQTASETSTAGSFKKPDWKELKWPKNFSHTTRVLATCEKLAKQSKSEHAMIFQVFDFTSELEFAKMKQDLKEIKEDVDCESARFGLDPQTASRTKAEKLANSSQFSDIMMVLPYAVNKMRTRDPLALSLNYRELKRRVNAGKLYDQYTRRDKAQALMLLIDKISTLNANSSVETVAQGHANWAQLANAKEAKAPGAAPTGTTTTTTTKTTPDKRNKKKKRKARDNDEDSQGPSPPPNKTRPPRERGEDGDKTRFQKLTETVQKLICEHVDLKLENIQADKKFCTMAGASKLGLQNPKGRPYECMFGKNCRLDHKHTEEKVTKAKVIKKVEKKADEEKAAGS
eukprot:g17738.t1